MSVTNLGEHVEVRCDRCRTLAFRVLPDGKAASQCRKDKTPVIVDLTRLAPFREIVEAAEGIRAEARAGMLPRPRDIEALDRALAALERPHFQIVGKG